MKLTEYEKERYDRHLMLDEIGEAGQQKLKDAKVLVVGAGGLGSPVLLYLTSAGVGTIGIIDDDVVSLSNLQRQVLYYEKDLGEAKVEKAKERLLNTNPNTNIEIYRLRLSESNVSDIFVGYDIIVDCTDNFKSRLLINKHSAQLSIPLVYGAVSPFEGQITVFNLPGSIDYNTLFPGLEKQEKVKNGIITTLPGITGSIQANEVIKIILGKNGVLEGKLLVINVMSMTFDVLTI